MTASAAARRSSSLRRDVREIIVDELWAYRGLLWQLTLRDIRIRYKQAVMGLAWAVLMPALVVAAGMVVRAALATAGGGAVDRTDLAAIAIKALGWSFFAGAIGFATTSLTSNAALVTKIYFPREVLPLSAVLAQGFDTLIGAATVGLVLIVAGIAPGAATLWVLPLALLLAAMTAGAALVLSSANLFFRDVKYVVQVLLTFGIFFTPVLVEPAMFGPDGARLLMWNPLAPVLEGLRLSLVHAHDLTETLIVTGAGGRAVLAWTPWDLAYAAAWAIALLVGGAILFHRAEWRFAEYA